MPKGRPKLSTLENPLQDLLDKKVKKLPKKLKAGSYITVKLPAMVVGDVKGNKENVEVYCEGHFVVVHKDNIC